MSSLHDLRGHSRGRLLSGAIVLGIVGTIGAVVVYPYLNAASYRETQRQIKPAEFKSNLTGSEDPRDMPRWRNPFEPLPHDQPVRRSNN